MPLYFFHTKDGTRHRDNEGTDLANHAAARLEAIKLIGTILADDPDVLWDGQSFQVDVLDESNAHLFSVVTNVVFDSTT